MEINISKQQQQQQQWWQHHLQQQQQQQQITAKMTHCYQTLQNCTQQHPSTVEKMNVTQPLKKFPTLYGNLHCITMFKTVHH
jgi:hypothetical protein